VNRRAALVGGLLLALSPLKAQSVAVRIQVKDPTGWMLPGAQVTLLGAKDKPIRTLTADNTGVLVWEDLPSGDSRFRVGMPGFISQVLKVTVHSDDYEEKVDVTLQIPVCNYLSDLLPQPSKRKMVADFPLISATQQPIGPHRRAARRAIVGLDPMLELRIMCVESLPGREHALEFRRVQIHVEHPLGRTGL